MQPPMFFKIFFILSLSISLALSHICILQPSQRGGISEPLWPGDPSCFQPNAPCGDKPVEQPKVQLIGGTSHYIQFQQNLNHYTVGNPGFFDIAYAIGTNQTSDDDFETLMVIHDYWSHFQGTQTNFSVAVEIPNIDCTHCTLRIRYHPNKPTEPIFHNCADVSIVKSNIAPINKRFFSFVTTKRDVYSAMVEVLLDGTIRSLTQEEQIYKRSQITHTKNTPLVPSDFTTFVAEGLVTVHNRGQSIWFLGGSVATYSDNYPSDLYHYSVDRDTIEFVANVLGDGVIVSILASENNLYFIDQIAGSGSNTGYAYRIRETDLDGKTTNANLGQNTFNSTFVNFFWADMDQHSDMIYVLSGDENSLTKLNVVLYIFDLAKKTAESVLLDNSAFTLSTIAVDHASGKIYSVSPGLVETAPEKRVWSLITVDPATGSITKVADLTQPGQFPVLNYGLGVYGPIINDGILYHRFMRNEESETLFAIDINTGKVVYSTDLYVGVNHELYFHTLVQLPIV